jgi:hypothetical protein
MRLSVSIRWASNGPLRQVRAELAASGHLNQHGKTVFSAVGSELLEESSMGRRLRFGLFSRISDTWAFVIIFGLIVGFAMLTALLTYHQ